jgi:DNA-binding NtrC family response regulator
MSLLGGTTAENNMPSSLTLKIPDGARILIVCDDDADAKWLDTVLRKVGLASERAKTITAGCEAAKSGRFQVIVSKPRLSDGSWRRLIDIANHYDLGFEVILWARNFDLPDWAEAMREGAFDVLDARSERPNTLEAALWAAYLKGAGPHPKTGNSRNAALFVPYPSQASELARRVCQKRTSLE